MPDPLPGRTPSTAALPGRIPMTHIAVVCRFSSSAPTAAEDVYVHSGKGKCGCPRSPTTSQAPGVRPSGGGRPVKQGRFLFRSTRME